MPANSVATSGSSWPRSRPAGSTSGSIEFVHKRIVAARDAGIPVMVVSTELDEVVALADRIAVMYRGGIVGIVPREHLADILRLMMAGETPGVAASATNSPAKRARRRAKADEPRTRSESGPSRRRRAPPPVANRVLHDIVTGNCVDLGAGGSCGIRRRRDPDRDDRSGRSEAAGYFFARPSDTFRAIGERSGEPTAPSSRGAVYNFRRPGFVNGIKPLTETLTFATPLIAAGLGVALAFRVGMFNIGGRGQILMAAAVGGWVGWSFELPFARPHAARDRSRPLSAARSGPGSQACSSPEPARTR